MTNCPNVKPKVKKAFWGGGVLKDVHIFLGFQRALASSRVTESTTFSVDLTMHCNLCVFSKVSKIKYRINVYNCCLFIISSILSDFLSDFLSLIFPSLFSLFQVTTDRESQKERERERGRKEREEREESQGKKKETDLSLSLSLSL